MNDILEFYTRLLYKISLLLIPVKFGCNLVFTS